MWRLFPILISLSLILAACSGLPAIARQDEDKVAQVSQTAEKPASDTQIEATTTPVITSENISREDNTDDQEPSRTFTPARQEGEKTFPSSECSPAPLPTGIVTARWNEPYRNNQLIVIDPVSELPLCDYSTYRLRDHMSHAFVEDGRTLAIADYSNAHAHQDLLHLIDLQTWTAITTTLDIGSWTAAMSFNPAGTHLALIYARERIPAPEFTIASINVATREVEAAVPLDFAPRLLKYSRDGASILVFGGKEVASEDSIPPARALLLDAADLNTLWNQSIPGVRIGNIQVEAEDDDLPMFEYLNPAIALSPDHTRLYIVHADEDKLTTVDFERRSVKTVEILPRLSWLERLIYRSAQTAYAKVSNGTHKDAALSPDGKRLYVTGQIDKAEEDKKGEWRVTNTPIDMQVIDVATGTELARLDTQATSVVISQDGAVLYLTGWDNGADWTDVVAADTLEVIQHLPRLSVVPTRLLSGQPVLLATRHSANSVRLALFDPDDPEQVEAWPARQKAAPGYPLVWEP